MDFLYKHSCNGTRIEQDPNAPQMNPIFTLFTPDPFSPQLRGPSLVLGEKLALGEALVLAPDRLPPTALRRTSVGAGLAVLSLER